MSEKTLNENNEKAVISLEEFTPEVYDCEADGSCGNGHIHTGAGS